MATPRVTASTWIWLVTLALPLCGMTSSEAQVLRKMMPRLYAPMKILILTDIHYGEFEGDIQGDIQDSMSTGVTEALLDSERPNLVVVLGDIVTGEDLRKEMDPIGFVAAMLRPMVARRVPFASTYGNHDISLNLSRAAIFGYERQLRLSLTQRQTPPSVSGITNYVLPIFSRARPWVAVAQLVFLDSSGVTGLGQAQGGVNWVTADQVTFLRRALLARPGVPTYVFVHIPPQQFQGLQDNFEANACVGLKAEPTLGTQDQDEGLWAQLLQSEQVVGVFSGHNHGSGWCCKAERGPEKRPLSACFARHSGYGGYGDWDKAGRVIVVPGVRSFSLTTWVRGADDSVSDRFLG